MSARTNLATIIEKQLPVEVIDLIKAASDLVGVRGGSLYLVGGVVRDLLMGKATRDIDLVVEGDAIELAGQLADMRPGRLTVHPRFNTAKIEWEERSVDLATARSESYARAGALPDVVPGSIEDDLYRRDFTINAMAINLAGDRYGELLDLHRGQEDLRNGLVRILHSKSFVDDATRIWRALRYEQRLDFCIEKDTLNLLRKDIPMLDTISGERIRYEVECVFREAEPEGIIQRAGELGVLARLHPGIRGNGWLAERFKSARRYCAPDTPSFELYLALLLYRLDEDAGEELVSFLGLPGMVSRVIRETICLRGGLRNISRPGIKRSTVYHFIHGNSETAVIASLLASGSAIIRRNLEVYLSELRYIKPVLTGSDLLEMGFSPSPVMKDVLAMLHDARLDGVVRSKAGEEALAKEWLDKGEKLGP
ncbi:MAG: CCA tRNA nucleotidyltransferase [Dehalococcoidales bacterium]